MAEASWFFSTIAQASATVVGFVLAFTAGIYTIRKNRIRQQVARYLDGMDSIYRDFDEPLLSMTDDLKDKGDFSAPLGGLSIQFDPDRDLVEWAKEEDSSVAVLWAHLVKIHNNLLLASSSSNAGDIPDSFDSLSSNVTKINTELDDDEFVRDIYEEASDKSSNDGLYEDSLFEFAESTKDLLERRSGKEPYTANSIQGIKDVTKELKIDTSSMERRHTPSRLSYFDQHPSNIFHKALQLFIVGVLSPALLLVTPPEDVDILRQNYSTEVFVIQILLLLAVAVISLQLVRSLWYLVEREDL